MRQLLILFLMSICFVRGHEIQVKRALRPQSKVGVLAAAPTISPTLIPTLSPSFAPSFSPTQSPSEAPTMSPTNEPTNSPSLAPTYVAGAPTPKPTTAKPTRNPTASPTRRPTAAPTLKPTKRPTVQPTSYPSPSPTSYPTSTPTARPTAIPTSHPTPQPSGQPTSLPTRQPSRQPSGQPSASPSSEPSNQPSNSPTEQPTARPSSQPSSEPSCQPSDFPSSQPTSKPSTSAPSSRPTSRPTSAPVSTPEPTLNPTANPSFSPTRQPTPLPDSPTVSPSSRSPTYAPSFQPTLEPTSSPSGAATSSFDVVQSVSGVSLSEWTSDSDTASTVFKASVSESVGVSTANVNITGVSAGSSSATRRLKAPAAAKEKMRGVFIDAWKDSVRIGTLTDKQRGVPVYAESVSSSVVVNYTIYFSYTSLGFTSASAAYSSLSASLRSAVSSGNFTAYLQYYASTLSCTILASASSSSVSVETLSVGYWPTTEPTQKPTVNPTRNPTADPTRSPSSEVIVIKEGAHLVSEDLTGGALAGIIIGGSFVVLCIVLALLYCCGVDLKGCCWGLKYKCSCFLLCCKGDGKSKQQQQRRSSAGAAGNDDNALHRIENGDVDRNRGSEDDDGKEDFDRYHDCQSGHSDDVEAGVQRAAAAARHTHTAGDDDKIIGRRGPIDDEDDYPDDFEELTDLDDEKRKGPVSAPVLASVQAAVRVPRGDASLDSDRSSDEEYDRERGVVLRGPNDNGQSEDYVSTDGITLEERRGRHPDRRGEGRDRDRGRGIGRGGDNDREDEDSSTVNSDLSRKDSRSLIDLETLQQNAVNRSASTSPRAPSKVTGYFASPMTSPGNPSMGSPDGDTGGDVGEGEDDARQHAAEERERAEPNHHDDPDPELVKLLAQAEISFLTTGRRMSMRQSVTSVSQSPRRTTAADKLQDISITATPGAPLVAADRAAMDTPSFDDSRLEQSYSTGGDDDTIGFPQTLNSPEVSMATTYGEITPETERRSISGINPAFGVVRRASDINNKKSAATAAVAADGKGDQRMSHTATGGDGNNSSAGNLSPIKESMVLGEEDEDDDYKLDYPASLGNSPNAYGGAVDSSYDTNGNGYPERSSPRSGGTESGQVSTSHGGDPLLGGDSEYDNDDENVAADDAVVYEDAEGGVEGLAAVNAKSKFVPIDTGGKTPVSQLDQREEKDHTSSEFSPYFFNFVARIPPKSDFYPDLHVDNISIQKPICDGSNSNIFDALMYDMPVVLKRIKASELQNEVAMSEFVRERDILSRVAHNNIICLYGAGVDSTNSHATERDRENGGEDDNDDAAIVDTSVEGNLPFLLLEPLQGNNLKALIHRKRAFFSTPFTYPQFLILASQLADAINYLHNDFNPSCIIIHRDIKPDNIGFAADGTLKLMDFGLSICIKRHPGENDKSHGGKGKGKGKDKGKRNKKQMLPTYMMTGETGSLRYMAPEVALTTPYNERVDIYSFGLVLYEMLTGVAPYGGISKDEFYTRVIEGGERPPTDMDDYGRRIRADTQILQLIERCWSANPQFRPDAEDILAVVNAVQDTKKKGGSDGKSGDCVIS